MIKKIAHKLGLNKITVLRKVVDFTKGTLRSTALPFPGRIQGFWIKGPALMDIIQGGYEPETTNYIKRIFKPNFTFVDVGADYGYYSLLVAKLSHNQANIHAFEPSINRYDQYLLPNIRRNKYKIHTYRLALSDSNTPAKFYLDGGSLYNVKNEDKGETVECNLMDNVIPQNTRIDLVKIDVEGGEINVIRGMERILKDNPQIQLIIEINPGVLARAGHSGEEILSHLTNRGFDMYRIEHNGSTSKFNSKNEVLEYAEIHKYINVLFKRP